MLEERWIPVTQSGDRWVGRSREQAERAMKDYPAGGTYLTGELWDGITHVVREARWVSEWTEAPE